MIAFPDNDPPLRCDGQPVFKTIDESEILRNVPTFYGATIVEFNWSKLSDPIQDAIYAIHAFDERIGLIPPDVFDDGRVAPE